jgi:hypothetical protein
MRISKATPEAVRQVALYMRERDFKEFAAVSAFDDRGDIADALAERYGESPEIHVGYAGDTPVCVGGTVQARPNVITLLFFATDDFPKIGLGITRYIRKQLFPRLIKAGVHRIEAVAMTDYAETRAWLRTIGLEAETGPLLGYGKNGEPFVQYSWSADARPFGH